MNLVKNLIQLKQHHLVYILIILIVPDTCDQPEVVKILPRAMTIKFHCPSSMGNDIINFVVQVRGGGNREWGSIKDVKIDYDTAIHEGVVYEQVRERVYLYIIYYLLFIIR